MDIPAIMAAFGGRVQIAKDFNTTPHAVSMWRRGGIPAKFHVALLAAARKRRLRGITVEALAQKPPSRSNAAAQQAQPAAVA